MRYALWGYCILVNTEVFLRYLNWRRIFSLTKALVDAEVEGRSSSQSLFPLLHFAKLHRICCKVFFGSFQKLDCLEKKTCSFYIGLFTFFFL